MNRLDKIEARANAATEGPWEADWRFTGWDISGNDDDGLTELIASDAYGEDAEFIAHARADVPDMAAALRAVLAIHQDGGESQGYLDDGSYRDLPNCCTECGSLGEYGVPFPCPTVTAIRRHLGDDL